MDAQQFRQAAHQMIDYVIDYMENIRQRRVLPEVKPGYMRELLPTEAPEHGEPWATIFEDVEKIVMPGVTHWNSPDFHAYYPAGNSWPAILADILSDAIGCIGFTWIASPACTELEIIVMDWLGKLLELPDDFLAGSGKGGGGVIQGTASEATMVAMLAARNRTNKIHARERYDGEFTAKLVAYTSDQAHSAAEKAGLLGDIRFRFLPTDENLSLRGDALQKAIEEDKAKGFIPFYVMATLGTTSTCAFDNLKEIGQVCHQHGIWLHIDAAYAGSAFICEEYRHHLQGIDYADSFAFNPHKWLLVNFDCSAMWLKKAQDLVDAFTVDPIFLRHPYEGIATDFRHWQIPLGRRFRSLKLWFVLRCYGAQGLREFIRKQVSLAGVFHQLVLGDDRFEVPVQPQMGLVCFRVKGENEKTERLLEKINEAGNIYVIPTKIRGQFIIRFAICSSYTELPDVHKAWEEIRKQLDNIDTA